jgi:hypothetical protein
MLPDEIYDMVFGFGSSICRQIEFGNEGAKFNLLFGGHRRDVSHQKETSFDLYFVPLVLELL